MPPDRVVGNIITHFYNFVRAKWAKSVKTAKPRNQSHCKLVQSAHKSLNKFDFLCHRFWGLPLPKNPQSPYNRVNSLRQAGHARYPTGPLDAATQAQLLLKGKGGIVEWHKPTLRRPTAPASSAFSTKSATQPATLAVT